MRDFRSILMILVMLVVLAWPAMGQQAVRTLGTMPASAEMVITMEQGAALMEVDDAMLRMLGEMGWLAETRPAFDVLAQRLGAEPAEAFARLMGHRATLVIRRGTQGLLWAVMTEVDEQTARALPGALDAKPLRVSSGLPVHGLERRTFEIAVSPTDAQTGMARAIIAPARAGELLNTLIQIAAGQSDPQGSIERGAHARLFAEPMEGSIAIYWSPSVGDGAQARALLAVMSTQEQSSMLRVRAVPQEAWVEVPVEDLGALPVLPIVDPSQEVLTAWWQRSSGFTLLDSLFASAAGPTLWSIFAPAPGARAISITRDATGGTTVRVAARSPEAATLLGRADGVLAEKAKAQAFEGHLPTAVRRSGVLMPAVLGTAQLTELVWWAQSMEDGPAAWLMAVGTERAPELLAMQSEAWIGVVGHVCGHSERTLSTGRARPTALIPLLAQMAAPPEVRTALSMVGKVSWRMWIDEHEVLCATVEMEIDQASVSKGP